MSFRAIKPLEFKKKTLWSYLFYMTKIIYIGSVFKLTFNFRESRF